MCPIINIKNIQSNPVRDESLPYSVWDDPAYIEQLEKRAEEDNIQNLYENGIENE